MKFKFGYSNFDRESGISSVTIYTPVGKFTGRAKLHDADRNEGRVSEFTGCRYAEYRARIKAMKEKHKRTLEKINAIENLYKEFKSCKNFNDKSIEAKHTRRYMDQLGNEYLREWETIKAMESGLRNTIKAHDEALAHDTDDFG